MLVENTKILKTLKKVYNKNPIKKEKINPKDFHYIF